MLTAQMEAHQACWVTALTSAMRQLATATDPLLPWFSREWILCTAPKRGCFSDELRSEQVPPSVLCLSSRQAVYGVIVTHLSLPNSPHFGARAICWRPQLKHMLGLVSCHGNAR